jgi:hypothetical protein
MGGERTTEPPFCKVEKVTILVLFCKVEKVTILVLSFDVLAGCLAGLLLGTLMTS